jgi:hypothetical protein
LSVIIVLKQSKKMQQNNSPVFSEAIRALVSGAGFVTLLLMFFYCRQGRTAEQSELIRTYTIFLGVLTAVAIFNIIRLVYKQGLR